MQRRRFMQALAATPIALGSGRVFAAPAAPDTRFLMVFLRGGYDAANLLIPHNSSLYYESRPTIAVPKPDAGNAGSALPLDADWSLHPSLRDTIYPLWKKGQASFIPFAGTHDLTRSHFETQDSIEGGQPLDGPREYGSGFLNRLAEELGRKASAVAFTDGIPIVMKGAASVPNLSLKAYGKAPFDDRQMTLLTDMYAGSPLQPVVAEGLSLKREVAKDYDAEQQAANRNAISAKGFELEARRMARMMQGKFNLGFIDVGGWDTHVNEGGAQGTLANNLDNLGKGLAGFAQEIGPAWKDTVVMVVSEFGRTFKENGTKGTDHGHGSVHWVLGGGIKGGKIHGQQVALAPDMLNQKRDYPVLNEYRAVMGGLFARLYGLNGDALARVFPRAIPADIGLV